MGKQLIGAIIFILSDLSTFNNSLALSSYYHWMNTKHQTQKQIQRNKQPNKQGGKKNKKNGQVDKAQEQTQPVNKGGPLTFGDDHQTKPAQDFASKKMPKKRRAGPKDDLPGVNKVKNHANCFMHKQDASTSQAFSSITEEMSYDGVDSLNYKETEIDKLKMMYDEEITILEMPSADQPGSFTIYLKPNCGVQEVGCSLVLDVWYESTESLDFMCVINEQASAGLDELNINTLQNELQNCFDEGDSLESIFQKMQDLLGGLNEQTRVIVTQKNQEEQRQKAEEQKQRAEKQRKAAEHQYSMYIKDKRNEFREELKWFQSLAQEQQHSRKRMPSAVGHKKEVAKENTEDKEREMEKSKDQKTEDSKQQREVLELDNLVSRYKSDFQEISTIGQGGFGIVVKARHRLDDNLYAVKKIKLPDKHKGKEKDRILREISYLSRLNHPNIVRYFQTWMEREKDPEVIKQFEDYDTDDYDSEEDSFEMRTEEVSDDTITPRRNRYTKRSSSLDRKSSQFMSKKSSKYSPQQKPPPFMAGLQADDCCEDEAPQTRKVRANTMFVNNLTPDMSSKKHTRQQQNSNYDFEGEEDDQEIVQQNHQDSEYTRLSPEDDDYSNFDFKNSFADNEGYNQGILQMGRNNSSAQNSSEKSIVILYIQMQLCEAQTLEDFILKNPSRTNEALKWNIFRQVLEAVNYLHQNDIIHRDIKPENIFLDGNNNVRLGDFGLARRIDKKQINLQKQDSAPTPEVKPSSSLLKMPNQACYKQLTTGVGTLRYAAPEQQNDGKKSCYGFKADIYSLGVVLLDLFRDFDISYFELDEIHQCMVKQEKVLPSLAEKMPTDAVTLIQEMVKQDPDQRPTLLDLMLHEALPQDDVLKNLLPYLSNYKSAVKLQLMRHLTSLSFPKAIEMAYNGIMRTNLDNAKEYLKWQQQKSHQAEASTPTLIRVSSLDTRNKKNPINKLQHKIKAIETYMTRNKTHDNVEANVIKDLRELFESNGASDMHNLHVVAPILSERSIFLSKAIRLEPWLKKMNENIQTGLTSVMHEDALNLNHTESEIERDGKWRFQQLQEEFSRMKETDKGIEKQMLSEDFLLMQNDCCERDCEEEKCDLGAQVAVKPFLDFMMFDQSSCWQQVYIRNLPEFTKPKNVSQLVDEKGIIVSLQSELVEAIAKKLAYQKSESMQKVFHIGQTFVDSTHMAKNPHDMIQLAPKGTTMACFALVNPMLKTRRNQFQTLLEMSLEELMLEVDLLRVTDQAFRQSKLASYELRVSSSELLDALFEECDIDLKNRVELMQMIHQSQNAKVGKSVNETIGRKKKIYHDIEQFEGAHKLLELMKISGSVKQIERQVQTTSGIRCKSRFEKVIQYFKRLEEYLKLFGVLSQDHDQLEEKKEHDNKWERRAQDRDTSVNKSNVRPPISVGCKLIFDFGLVLEQQLTHYAGMICSVTVKPRTSTRVGSAKNQSQTKGVTSITLAYGGRFDNSLAYHQTHVQKQIPAAVGITINCAELSNQILAQMKSKSTCGRSTIDFCIGSVGAQSQAAIQMQKIQIMQALQQEDWRVHVDYSEDMHVQVSKEFLEDNNVRFLIQVEDESRILFTDRFSYLTQSSRSVLQSPVASNVQTMYESLEQLQSDLRKKKRDLAEGGSKA